MTPEERIQALMVLTAKLETRLGTVEKVLFGIVGCVFLGVMAAVGTALLNLVGLK